MSELSDAGAPTVPARERLLAAALQVLFERGYRGATSREIARVAQVNEVTLFRLFTTKDDLLAAAMVMRAEVDQALVLAPTGDLEADLEALAVTVTETLAEGGYLLLRIMPEVSYLPEEQRATVRAAMGASLERFASLFRHYQAAGALEAAIGDHILTVFVGPILMAVRQAELEQRPLQFEARQHVRLFLRGCSATQAGTSD